MSKLVLFGLGDIAQLAHYYFTHDSEHEVVAFTVDEAFCDRTEFEGLPVALLEAMSTECAVVCTDAGGIKEVIRNNVDGFMLPVENWKGLLEPLSYLVNNPGEIKSYGAKARKRVEESFSLKVMVQQIEQVYASIASAH